MRDPVLVSDIDAGAIRVITLNMPDKRNPLTGAAMLDALENALRAADAADAVRCVVLTGAGSAFSSGGDLNDMVPGGALVSEDPARTRDNYRTGIQRLPRLFESIEVPVIAAVNGAAVGAGCDLACMCDIRIAGQSARFAESFVKLGLISGDGGAWLLPAVVGYSQAAEMALTGDWVGAEAALAMGLVSRVVADADLMDMALDLARRIAANPPQATRITKRLLKRWRDASLDDVLDHAASAQALMHTTAEHRAAVDRFLKR
ncbi:enoyl-CoA hydratase-related protein [Croceicoccus bisphenolivorans]|uniref:enoyl-CoA hydratase-related protein n=1 Tax=Croceicoccus bisphenolivorans TaxID=1783232 RepID=UPI000830A568|nr:enoyl-CoA hydratase-related protein [Croceicoccus bisphenolivorans]